MRGQNVLRLALCSEILTVHKKESADNNQFEEPKALLILALYYKDKLIQSYGPLRTEEIINRYLTMDYVKSDALKKEKQAAKQQAEEHKNLKLKLMVESGQRAQERIDLDKKRLEFEEKKLTQQPQPQPQQAPRKSMAQILCEEERLLEKPKL
jgi:hypothetical protein